MRIRREMGEHAIFRLGSAPCASPPAGTVRTHIDRRYRLRGEHRRQRAIDGAATPNLTLVYVGAADCAPCQTWARDHRLALLASAQFMHVTYREVISPRLL